MIQAIKLFEIFKTKFSDEQAKFIVEEVVKNETEVEIKIEKVFADKKDVYASKGDILTLKVDIFDLKQDNLLLRIEMEKWFNTILKWLVGTMIALAAICIAITKLLH
jgi:hypothetical protein